MPEAESKALLEVQHGDEPPISVQLLTPTVRIGRAKDSEVHIAAPHVSKQHAEIRFEGEGFHLFDVGSKAGVVVNGRHVMRHLLSDGDVIELGEESPVRMTFRAARTLGQRAETARMLAEPADSARGGMARLARFFEFSRKLGGGFTIEEVLHDVVDLAIEVTGAERGMVIQGREDGGFDVRVARVAGRRSLPRDDIRVSETLVRQSMDHGWPRIVTDVSEDIDLAHQASIMSLELRSAVTLPLSRAVAMEETQSKGNVFGVLYLDSKKRHAKFDGIDLELLSRLAQDASSVIENARLMRDAEDKRRMDLELQTAREVQEALLPEQFDSTEFFEVAGLCIPCHELGGDYVDQFELADGRQALVIADVCGKGIAASLLAATLQGALASEITRDRPLGEVVERVNRVHCQLAPIGRFITMAVVLLDKDGRVSLVNAGHCPPLHVRSGSVSEVGASAMALGLDEDASYTTTELQLEPGESLVLCTDGVIECEGPGRELFGQRRFEDLLSGHHGTSANDLLEAVRASVEQFRRDTPVSDDLTLLVVARK
jgi:serine phosphatase RsbU (regulator of sigma subunit)